MKWFGKGLITMASFHLFHFLVNTQETYNLMIKIILYKLFASRPEGLEWFALVTSRLREAIDSWRFADILTQRMNSRLRYIRKFLARPITESTRTVCPCCSRYKFGKSTKWKQDFTFLRIAKLQPSWFNLIILLKSQLLFVETYPSNHFCQLKNLGPEICSPS